MRMEIVGTAARRTREKPHSRAFGWIPIKKLAYNRPYGGHYQPTPDHRRVPLASGRRRFQNYRHPQPPALGCRFITFNMPFPGRRIAFRTGCTP